MNDVLYQIGAIGIVPVITIESAADAEPLGRALMAGNLPCAEITLRTPASMDSLRALAQTYPDMLVGAGTVLSVDQAEEAVKAGARYIVSPGFDPVLVDWCLARGVPVTPGAATPTEIIMARNKGLRILKFFPAEVFGGPKAIQTIGEPFKDIRFLPTGGITPATLPDYLRLPMIHACGGSWMANKSLIAGGKFDEITRLSNEAVEMVRRVRGGV